MTRLRSLCGWVVWVRVFAGNNGLEFDYFES